MSLTLSLIEAAMQTKSNPYDEFLSSERARPTTVIGRTLDLESESDRSRIVFSPPFRRLQQKAQVFSLEENAAVRSRLTQSLEVAQIGRFLSEKIATALIKQNELRHEQARAFLNFVETACLMHDLGNPPFGHFGEYAISEWFNNNGETTICESINAAKPNPNPKTKKEIENILADFYEFDGNCQGLRIASLLQWNGDHHGLNLTFTTYYSYLKYIRGPVFDKKTLPETPPRHQKKAGYFNSEKQLIAKIYDHYKIDHKSPKRFPLTYIMEAADDMAYCLSDLEDALEKGLLQYDRVFADLSEIWDTLESDQKTAQGYIKIKSIIEEAAKTKNFISFKTTLLNHVTDQAVSAYVTQHALVLKGELQSIIDEKSPEGIILDRIKTYCRSNVYNKEPVQRIELTGLSAIRGLLDHFHILLKIPRSRFTLALNNKDKDENKDKIVVEKKLLSLFPPKHIKAYQYIANQSSTTDLQEWHARAHLITDFISGMTDDFALSTYQMLAGIKY